jgi:hypothetical protein
MQDMEREELLELLVREEVVVLQDLLETRG